MRVDKGIISGERMFFTVVCFIQASSLLTSFVCAVTRQDSWLAVIMSVVVCLPLIWLYRMLMVTFPEKNLIQMLESVFGKVVGKILGLSYVWFFVTLSSLNLIDLSDLTKLAIMDEMPRLVMIVLCAIVTAYAVRNGVRTVTWYSGFFMVVSCVIVLLTIVLVVNQMDFENLLPFFDLPVIKYVQGVHIVTTIPFGELVAFLMITPNIKITPKEATKYLFTGFGVGGITLLIIVMRDVAVLGNTTHLFALPSLVTLQLVRLGEALTRMEILFIVILIMLLFFKITFLCYVTTIALAQIFNCTGFKHLALSVVAFTSAYGLTLYSSQVEHAASGQEITPVAWTLFEIIIPLVLFVCAKIQKRARKVAA